jgi:hypothetical protein
MKHITQAVRNLLPEKSFKFHVEPKSEQEFISSFEVVTHITEEGDAVFSSNQSDFGVTWNQIQEEVSRLKQLEIAEAYKAKRQAEYPPITDYLDGVVKGDQAQIDKYIADCLAVKTKYPKGA